MLSGEFERKLRRLTRGKVRIFCGDSDSTPAGVYFVTRQGDCEQLCGADKHYLPEYTQWGADGTIKKGGWRRILRILIEKRFIDRYSAERVFNTHLEYAPKRPKPKLKRPSVDKVANSYGMQVLERGHS